jgi:hypothetical protein
MNNPYQSPIQEGEAVYPQAGAARPGIFVLAAVGAWLAGAYWGLLTLGIVMGVATGALSFIQILIPVVLIVMYVGRGYQSFQGNAGAMNNLLWLHGVGGLIGLMHAAQGEGFVAVLHGAKVGIHIFGGLTVYLALQHVKKTQTAVD